MCSVPDILDNEEKCGRCSEYLRKRLHLVKQRLVKTWIDCDDELKTYSSYDRQIGDGCGRERPDFLWRELTHNVCLEVDEHQHRNSECECEVTRMSNVTEGLAGACVWVRYNPDNFRGQSKSLTERNRRDLLLRVLKDAKTMIPSAPGEMMRVTYLFFDNFKPGDPITYSNIPIV